MQIQAIVDLINFKLAGEMLSIRETLPHMDDVITDINDRLNTIFPYVSDVHAAGNTEYTAFPDKYLRSVVVLGAAHYFYVTDEEGGLEDAGYYTKYQNALFVMERDYLTLVPDEYKACNLQGTTPFNLTGAVGYGIYDFPLSRKDPRLAPYYSGGACPDGGSSGGQVNDPLPIGYGGTSANNAADARHLLGADNADNIVQGTLNISHGGTGANNAQDARRTLGANDANNINRGTLAIENGGTNATTAAEARDNLGLTNLENFTEGVLPITQGGTGATTLAEAKNNLGIQNINLPLALSDGGTGSSSVATARANLGADNAGNITKGVLPIAHGGTGAATIAEAKANLGIVDAPTVTYPIPVDKGGTNATDTTAARNNLGVTSAIAAANTTTLGSAKAYTDDKVAPLSTAIATKINEAPSDGRSYARHNASWQAITASGNGIPEAPSDGKQYARQDGDWFEVTGGGGSSSERFADVIIAAPNTPERFKSAATLQLIATDDIGAVLTAQYAALGEYGVIYLLPGSYNLTSTIIASAIGQCLIGAGAGRTSITYNHATNYLFRINGAGNIVKDTTISGITFSNSLGHCIFLGYDYAATTYNNNIIKDCVFNFAKYGVQFATQVVSHTVSTTRNTIINNTFNGTTMTESTCIGLYMGRSTLDYIANNYFFNIATAFHCSNGMYYTTCENNYINNFGKYGFNFSSTTETKIEGNQFYLAGYNAVIGLHIQHFYSSAITKNTFIGSQKEGQKAIHLNGSLLDSYISKNYIRYINAQQIHLQLTNIYSIGGVKIESNSFGSNNGAAIVIELVVPAPANSGNNSIIIIGNTFNDSLNVGVDILRHSSISSGLVGNGIVITGNTFAQFSVGIRLTDIENALITSNTFTKNGGLGSVYPVYLSGLTTGTLITCNNIKGGNVTDASSGTNTIINNNI